MFTFVSVKGAFEELATHLLDSTEILAKNWNILDNVLETLDVQQHSLGVMYVLIAKFNSLAVWVVYNSIRWKNLMCVFLCCFFSRILMLM